MANASGYKPLKTVFHASRHGHSALEKEYVRRLDSPATLQWEFDVAGYPLFLVMTVELAAQLEKIWHTELRFSDKWAALPGIGRQHYLLGILISEIRATNAIEGIFSTRKEIASALSGPLLPPTNGFGKWLGCTDHCSCQIPTAWNSRQLCSSCGGFMMICLLMKLLPTTHQTGNIFVGTK
ncbi:hypothetical protein [Corynebacterium propinquum]